MSQSGMTYRDILASLTTNPATFFKVANTGRVEEAVDAYQSFSGREWQSEPPAKS